MQPSHIEHIGIAVTSLDESIPFFEKEPCHHGGTLFAGLLGFEPRNDGVRVRCLTVWR